MELFQKEDIEELIYLLATKLNDEGVSGKISIVGGAALSVAYLPERAATMDIDATYPNDPRVGAVFNQIAFERNLPINWINNAVNAYIPFAATEMWVQHREIGQI